MLKSLLDAMASMATPGSKGHESSRNIADLTESWIRRNIENSYQVLESVRK